MFIVFFLQIIFNFYGKNNRNVSRNNNNNFQIENSFSFRVFEIIKFKIIYFFHFIIIAMTHFSILYFSYNKYNPFKFKSNNYFIILLGLKILFYLTIILIQILFMIKFELSNQNNIQINYVNDFHKKKFSKKYNYQKALGEIIIMKIDIEHLDCSICLLSFKSILLKEKIEIIIKGNYKVLHSEKNKDDFCINFYSNFYYSKEMDRKQTIMLTPCKHIFHVKCLLKWMNYKKKCPLCRLKLPK